MLMNVYIGRKTDLLTYLRSKLKAATSSNIAKIYLSLFE